MLFGGSSYVAVCDAVGVTHPVVLACFTFQLLMFIFRTHEDGKECERKHGSSSWTRYCQRVRSRLIPYIYWCCVNGVEWLEDSMATLTSGCLNCSACHIGGSDWLFRSLCGIVLPCTDSFPPTDIVCVYDSSQWFNSQISCSQSVHFVILASSCKQDAVRDTIHCPRCRHLANWTKHTCRLWFWHVHSITWKHDVIHKTGST